MKSVRLFLSIVCTLYLLSCAGSGERDITPIKNWEVYGGMSFSDAKLTLSGKDAKFILKQGKYVNFELNMDVCTAPGAKGSVWFHTDNDLTKGYSVAINNDREDPEWWKMSGSLLSVRNLTKSFVKENEWFNLKIKVYGKQIQVNINDEPVVDYIEPDVPYRTGENKNRLLSSGTIALICNGTGTIEFKNMKIKELSAPEKEVINQQQTNAVNEQQDDIIRLHQEDFPVLDYHVHLKGGLTKEVAAAQSRKTGINYAVAPNCGIGFPITNDREVLAYLDTMRSQPFILAMQAEGREWIGTFSQGVRNEFDYVFTDALTFTDSKGRRTRLWIPEETWIEDEQKYMDLIVNKICDVLQEPMDIYVNSCFLPVPMSDRYDELWTEARMNKFVDAMAKSGKALEINDRYEIPNKAIIMKAKDAGIKFTFGTNNVIPEVGMLEYCIRMKKECGLTASDMYKPKIKI